MALVPVLEESAPQDYFLLIGNDNDFLSSTCSVGGQNCAQSVNSDARGAGLSPDPADLCGSAVSPVHARHRAGGRRHDRTGLAQAWPCPRYRPASASAPSRRGIRPAQSAAYVFPSGAAAVGRRQNETPKPPRGSTSATLGVDAELDELDAGRGASALPGAHANIAAGFGERIARCKSRSMAPSSMDGFFADLTGTYSDQHFSDIKRPGAYGVTGTGKTGRRELGASPARPDT